jgi:hypothetical protein
MERCHDGVKDGPVEPRLRQSDGVGAHRRPALLVVEASVVRDVPPLPGAAVRAEIRPDGAATAMTPGEADEQIFGVVGMTPAARAGRRDGRRALPEPRLDPLPERRLDDGELRRGPLEPI